MKLYYFKFYDKDHNHVETARFMPLDESLDEAWKEAAEYAYRNGYADAELKEENA